VLILEASQAARISVGRLGELHIEPGWYAYVGSAFGPGGVAARCGHHREIARRPHWHIDYLRAVCELREIWFSHDPQRREHAWAELLQGSRGSRQPFAGFGATDCDCGSHLFRFTTPPSFPGFKRRLKRAFPGHERVLRELVAAPKQGVSD
jgi:Uri superfamily endonuclease